MTWARQSFDPWLSDAWPSHRPETDDAPPLPDRLHALGIRLRGACADDMPFLLALHRDFRAEEMAPLPWPKSAKDAFLDDQFRLQHLHFVTYYSEANFWIVEQARAPTPLIVAWQAVGRFYLDRSTPLWRVVEIGLTRGARGQGIGGGLLVWAQDCAVAAGAEGIDLHVHAGNLGATDLYRSLGFCVEGDLNGSHHRMTWSAIS